MENWSCHTYAMKRGVGMGVMSFPTLPSTEPAAVGPGIMRTSELALALTGYST